MMRSNRCFARAGSQTARSRTPRARQFWRAHGTRTRGLRTAATTKRRFNRVIAQRPWNAAQ
eukprot:8498901-Lingulodinium_polyedra.AAC.1